MMLGVIFSSDVMFDKTKNGIEESVSKDSDAECVHLESTSDDGHTEGPEEEPQSPQEEYSEPTVKKREVTP